MVRKDTHCAMRGTGHCPRPLEQLASFISKKWTLSILITIGNFEVLRFSELKNRVSGISPKTLANRLANLSKRGLLRRQAYAEIPPRVEYSLTQRGKTLYTAVLPLLHWAEHYDS